jgi:hypothetical protein
VRLTVRLQFCRGWFHCWGKKAMPV